MIKNHLTKSLLILFFIAAGLNACKKSSSDNTDPNKRYLLSKVYTNGKISMSYTYNNAYMLVSSSATLPQSATATYTIVTSYYYNNDHRLIRTESINYGVSGGDIKEYGYDNQGRLDTIRSSDKDHHPFNATLFSYAGNTITETRYQSDTIARVKVYTVDDRGNIVKAVTDDRTAPNADITEEWLEYDDKKNVDGPSAGDVTSKNNPRRYLQTFPNGPANEWISEHSYNRADYVAETKSTHSNYTTTNVIKYEYLRVE